uniref:Uncharacterized protein n=1 Tax=Anopheles quadriannulatus TaxID=34691 RepID=A0A182XS83_ANOQN
MIFNWFCAPRSRKNRERGDRKHNKANFT